MQLNKEHYAESDKIPLETNGPEEAPAEGDKNIDNAHAQFSQVHSILFSLMRSTGEYETFCRE